MAAKEFKHNFRVVITPRRLGDYRVIKISDNFVSRDQSVIEKGYRDRCEEIVEQVKRHVDNIGDVEIEWDSEVTCEHCGSNWEAGGSGICQECEPNEIIPSR